MPSEKMSLPKIAEKVPDEAAAYEFMEGLRWADGPVCPHCGATKAYFLTPKDDAGRKTRTGNRSARRVWKCAKCRRQFSVITKTIFHGTKIPLRTWIMVVFEIVSSKNGVSAREVERKYAVDTKTAWFMLHRLREAMKRGPLVSMMTGEIEVDETYFGRSRGKGYGPHWEDKTPVVTLINRESGEARSTVVDRVNGATLGKVLREHMSPDAILMTDKHSAYRQVGTEFAEHHTVNHEQDEYARTTSNGRRAGINRAEGFFGQLKRSIDGTHHFVTREHLHRYVAEFDFRYSTREMDDTARMARLMGQTGGRRLSYRPLVGE